MLVFVQMQDGTTGRKLKIRASAVVFHLYERQKRKENIA